MPKKTVLRKVIADTSSLISLGTGRILEESLTVIEIFLPEEVKSELESVAIFEDVHGQAANEALCLIGAGKIHVLSIASATEVDTICHQNRRIDRGEAAAILLAEQERIDIILSDDFKALSQMARITDKRIYLSVYALSRLVEENLIALKDAEISLNTIAAHRNWIGRSIFDLAKKLIGIS
ncbi:MAG: hypothetical protein O7E52_15685 [Candidatus Poribacteria bacterium]|nr:hypothetical protein [Candidatus Poribacteria bacterium]